jgi:GntR family transcriptional repressor for pyruvate dehydrogenase complex
MLDLPASVAKVVHHLREDILRGRLRPGDRLPSERDLAERIGVNRGAVREARRTLAQLGLVEIGPGGARVVPLSEASLGVVDHLLSLDELPDPVIVSHVFEAGALLFSGAAALFAERASDDELEAARAILERAQQLGETGVAPHETFHELVRTVVDGTGNFVLGLIRRNLRLQFAEQFRELESVRDVAPRERSRPVLVALDRALAERDGERAAQAIRELFRLQRNYLVAALEKAHEPNGGAPAGAASVLESLRPTESR